MSATKNGVLCQLFDVDEGECAAAGNSLPAVFNALRYLVRVGGAWRMLPNDLPPWRVVHQQIQRWIKAGCFEAMAHDLRAIVRMGPRGANFPAPVWKRVQKQKY